MDAILPPIGPTSPGQNALAAGVLLVVLVIGFLAGRAKKRFGLLIGGVVGLIVVGVVLTVLTGVRMEDRLAWAATLLPLTVPLLVAFLAGWLSARAGWFMKVVIVAAAVILLAAFPYAAASETTARLLGGG